MSRRFELRILRRINRECSEKGRNQEFSFFVPFAVFAVNCIAIVSIKLRVKIKKLETIVMRFKIAALMFFIAATAISSMAQNKTVTNADLEKYRQARLAAEREYRENYERLGMPSPTELERRREHSRIETERLSEKLRSEELDRERLNAAMGVYEQPSVQILHIPQPQGYGSIYYWSNGRRYRSPRPQYVYQQSGYIGGGTFWPTGSRTPSQPAFKRVRR